MRIGIDARFLGASSYGLAQYSENLLLALSRLDSDNDYTVFVNSALNRKLKTGKNFRSVPIAGRPLSAGGLARLRLALRKESLDLLHVHFPLAPIGLKIPTVITVHDIVPFRRGGAPGERFRLWDRIGGRFLYPMTMRRARWILCVSKSTRDKLVEIFPDVFHKTILLASGVEDLYRTQTKPAASELIRSRLRVPRPYLLYSGSSGESKNIPRMLQAFATLCQNDPRGMKYHFLLDIAGDSGGLDAIRRTSRQYGIESRVSLMSELSADERHVLFEQASMLFIASKEEGFGFPVLKAQLCGVPVLAADAGALPEVAGEGALLVDPDDPVQLVAMLEKTLFDTSLRKDLMEKGRRNAARYSWDDTARQVRQIYELLV